MIKVHPDDQAAFEARSSRRSFPSFRDFKDRLKGIRQRPGDPIQGNPRRNTRFAEGGMVRGCKSIQESGKGFKGEF